MGQAYVYGYDAAGNCTEILDAKGHLTTYEYNILNLPAKVRYFEETDYTNSAKWVEFVYTGNGKLASYVVEHFNGALTSAYYTYDGLGRKTGESVDYGSFIKSYDYAYPNASQKVFTGPDSTAVTYTYDGAYRLASVQIPGQGQITYNSYNWNSPASVTLPGNNTVLYEHTPLLQLQSITARNSAQSTLFSRIYDYSATGNVKSKNTEHGNYTYQYDPTYRLTEAVNPSPLSTEAYTYDDLGNRITKNGITGNWTYNKNNELDHYSGATFTYDDNGNITGKQAGSVSTIYIHDIENRLKSVEDGSENIIANYGYDPFGRRLWKEVSGVKTYYFYSDEGLIGEYNNSGNEIRTYGYTLGSEWTTAPLYQKVGSNYYWYLNDHLGTPQKIINNSGTVVWSAVYDSFGNAQISTEQITNNLRFPGQYYDQETGLHYNYNVSAK